MKNLSVNRRVMIATRLKCLEEIIDEKIKDKYFADSWEQRNQISEEIAKLETQRRTLKAYLYRQHFYDHNAMIHLLHEWFLEKRAVGASKNSIILESLSCTNSECSFNCNGACMHSNSFLTHYEFHLPEVDGCGHQKLF